MEVDMKPTKVTWVYSRGTSERLTRKDWSDRLCEIIMLETGSGRPYTIHEIKEGW
jgi:hypothetical protein